MASLQMENLSSASRVAGKSQGKPLNTNTCICPCFGRRLNGKVNRGLLVRAALIPKPNTDSLGIDVRLRSQSIAAVSVEFCA